MDAALHVRSSSYGGIACDPFTTYDRVGARTIFRVGSNPASIALHKGRI